MVTFHVWIYLLWKYLNVYHFESVEYFLSK